MKFNNRANRCKLIGWVSSDGVKESEYSNFAVEFTIAVERKKRFRKTFI